MSNFLPWYQFVVVGQSTQETIMYKYQIPGRKHHHIGPVCCHIYIQHLNHEVLGKLDIYFCQALVSVLVFDPILN